MQGQRRAQSWASINPALSLKPLSPMRIHAHSSERAL
jgi:hypothetical protein